jgi:hypothetical protein
VGDFGVGRNPVALAPASRAGGLESVARGRAGEVSEKRPRPARRSAGCACCSGRDYRVRLWIKYSYAKTKEGRMSSPATQPEKSCDFDACNLARAGMSEVGYRRQIKHASPENGHHSRGIASPFGCYRGSGTCRCLDCEDLFDHACVPDMLVLRNFERDTATAAKRGGTRLHKYRRPTIPMRSRAALGSFTREHRAMKIFAYWSFGRNLAGGAG